AAQVADVAGHAVAGRQRDIETAVGAALLALVVARIAVDEAVGEHEVHRVAGERFQRTVEFMGDGCVGNRCSGGGGGGGGCGDGPRPRATAGGGQAGTGQDGEDRWTHVRLLQ